MTHGGIQDPWAHTGGYGIFPSMGISRDIFMYPLGEGDGAVGWQVRLFLSSVQLFMNFCWVCLLMLYHPLEILLFNLRFSKEANSS
jgi:hypothetical protein